MRLAGRRSRHSSSLPPSPLARPPRPPRPLLRRSDVAFVALNSANEVAAVFPDGRTKTVATAADGLDSPTDTAVRGSQIFITDGGGNPPHNAQLQAGKINFAALFGS
jgi:hypothetical protein